MGVTPDPLPAEPVGVDTAPLRLWVDVEAPVAAVEVEDGYTKFRVTS